MVVCSWIAAVSCYKVQLDFPYLSISESYFVVDRRMIDDTDNMFGKNTNGSIVMDIKQSLEF